MEDVTLLAPAWEKGIEETSQDKELDEGGEEVEATPGDDDAASKEEL